jgi:hypothetical protein
MKNKKSKNKNKSKYILTDKSYFSIYEITLIARD